MPDKEYYIMLSMIETIDKIIRYTRDYKSAEELYQNDRDFDAAMMNIIAHHYFGINVDIVWQIIRDDLPKLQFELKQLIKE